MLKRDDENTNRKLMAAGQLRRKVLLLIDLIACNLRVSSTTSQQPPCTSFEGALHPDAVHA